MPKSNRRSTPYGPVISPPGTPKRFLQYADSVHVRELSFGSGGIGCGLWNASIILSRFILEHPDVFMGKTVHEVGAGVGLPILYASYFAHKAIFSDYMTPLIDNFRYNVECNVNQLEVDNAFDYNLDEIKKVMAILESEKLSNEETTALDQLWQVTYQNQSSVEKRLEDDDNYIVSTQPEIDYPVIDLKAKFAEYQVKMQALLERKKNLEKAQIPEENQQIPQEKQQIPQEKQQIQQHETEFQSNTCLSHSPSCGCIGYTPPSNYNTFTYQNNREEITKHRQECLLNMKRSSEAILLDWFNFDSLPSPLKNSLKSDIILGSEVCYPTILDALPALVTLIQQTLSDKGAFYLIQSPNRGTSIYFIEELCAKLGLLLDMRVVNLDILTPFSSGQRDENYVYYTFRRPGSPYPIMGYENDYAAPVDGLSAESLRLINTDKNKVDLSSGAIIPAVEVVFDVKLAEPVCKVLSEKEGEQKEDEKVQVINNQLGKIAHSGIDTDNDAENAQVIIILPDIIGTDTDHAHSHSETSSHGESPINDASSALDTDEELRN